MGVRVQAVVWYGSLVRENGASKAYVGKRKNGNNTFYLNLKYFVFFKSLPGLWSQISHRCYLLLLLSQP